jgi:TetR/AcrR family transcriptional regulator, regulator of cefoperazone and chloramphenicol sensitivity
VKKRGASGAARTDRETRERLLHASEQLFASRGFKDVTVRDIARAARANVAAVNYHFGDKQGLYREVLQVAIDAMRETNEAGQRAAEGQPAAEKLRRYLSVFLRRVLNPENDTIHRLIQREADHPTPAMDTMIEQALRPRLEFFAAVVAELMGCDPADPRVLRCVGSILAQTIIYVRKNPIAERLGFVFKPTPENIEFAARHIAEFSVAGIRAVAAQRPPSERRL